MTRIICLLFIVLAVGCTNNDINKKFDCSTSDLAIELVSKSNTSSCNAIDGKLSVSATGGKQPYSFSLNGGVNQPSNEFLNLGPGTYNVIVKDANECKVTSTEIDISAPNSNLNATAVAVRNNQCTNPNGSITVTASGGTSPYSFQFGTAGFTSSNVFNNVKHGTYNLIVKDATDCQKIIAVTVPRENTNTSYLNTVKPILDASCNLASCHSGGSRDLTDFQNLKNRAASVKARTANKSMPPSGSSQLTQAQIDLIGCWVDDGALNN
jgi:SprB repeat